MFQERFGSSSSRSRVHSAPPIDAQKKRLSLRSTHARAPENSLHKPATPDPENLYRILQARISSALSGPELKLRKRNSDESSIESKKLFPGKTSRDIYGSNTLNLHEGMFLRIEDVDEINMLRSIARSEYASSFSRDDPSSSRLERLRIHEFEDNSDDEMPNPSEHGRRRNLVRQAEQDEPETLSGLSLQPRSASAGIRGRTRISNMEIRLSGYRHEKMRSSTRSGELTEDQVSGLVYDPDFDCYYNPQDDQYYRLEPTTKSEA